MKRMFGMLLKVMRVFSYGFIRLSRTLSSFNMISSTRNLLRLSSDDSRKQKDIYKSVKSQDMELFSDKDTAEPDDCKDIATGNLSANTEIHTTNVKAASTKEISTQIALNNPKNPEFDSASDLKLSLEDSLSTAENKPVTGDGDYEDNTQKLQTANHGDNKNILDASGNSTLDWNNSAMVASETNSEISIDKILTSMPLDNGSLDKNVEDEASINSDNIRTKTSEPDIESNVSPNPRTPLDEAYGDQVEQLDTDGQITRELTDTVESLDKHKYLIAPATNNLTCTEIDKKDRVPRKPAPLEDVGPYKILVGDVSDINQEYTRWNQVIVEQLLLSKTSTEKTYLCVNPRILARAYEDAGFGLLTSVQAEQRFLASTARIYRERVLNHSDGLRVLRRCGNDSFPDCAAFLATSVLAAYRMRSDEKLSGNAYYRRLANILECEMHGNYPIGFRSTVFESLWMFLHNWLHKNYKRQLAMPTDKTMLKRFIALPLAHVPLRYLDIEKLPAFFSWAGYQPGDRLQRDSLITDLQLWQSKKNILTETGLNAISDDRSEAVLAQISAELESWDGGFSESDDRRSASIEIQFDIVQRKPILSYLPRRPSNFPDTFDAEEHILKASSEGWYEPLHIHPKDGELLESGFEWRSRERGLKFILRRPEALVIPLTPSSNYSGFLSSKYLLRGVKCAVLCRNKIVDNVKEYISEVAKQEPNTISNTSLPMGWSIIHNFTAHAHIKAPAGLEKLEIDPNIELHVTGGLRIGRRWSWLADVPPQVLVSGVEDTIKVKINGEEVDIDENGKLLVAEVLSEPGKYLIEAGHTQRRLEIIDPSVSIQNPMNQPISTEENKNVRVALPHGNWTILGKLPGQLDSYEGEFFRGTLASCPFDPVWAIQVGAGAEACIAILTRPVPPPELDHLMFEKNFARWARIIYNAYIRHPKIVGLNGIFPDNNIVLMWNKYVATAKQIKRNMKKKL